MNSGSLYIVATPIGNLSDITLRAIDVLKGVDLIASEDTRHSKILLRHYNIHTRVISLHAHNEAARITLIENKLREGQNVALISDAGTPLISDPGYRLVTQIRQHFQVIPIPGPCAAIAALVASGLPTDHFLFEGFLPARAQAREKHIESLKNAPQTLIFYESVHRITALIDSLNKILGGDRQAALARELTKTYETIVSSTLAKLKEWLTEHKAQQKGEFVVLIKGSKTQSDTTLSSQNLKVLQTLLGELPVKQAVSLTCQITGLKRSLLYPLALKLKKG